MAGNPIPAPDTDPDDLLRVAIEAATAASELIVSQRPAELDVERKTSPTDHVTQMDRAAEALLRRIIGSRRPHDTLVGEEQGRGGGSGPVTWWIDPIDGTTNYVYDHPGYAVSVAATVAVPADGPVERAQMALNGPGGGEERLQVLAGVVADPTHGRLYEAALNRGSRCNGELLRLPAAGADLPGILVATGFGYDPSTRACQGRLVAELLPRIRDIRRVGAASLDLCSVAAGRVDAYFETGLSVWDLAAGILIASEAGAGIAALDGGPPRADSVLAAHPDRLAELREVIAWCGFAAEDRPAR